MIVVVIIIIIIIIVIIVIIFIVIVIVEVIPGTRACSLGGFKGSATEGQSRKCGSTVCCSKYDPNKNKEIVCNKALESKRKHLVQIDPLSWTLNFLSRSDPQATPGPRIKTPPIQDAGRKNVEESRC